MAAVLKSTLAEQAYHRLRERIVRGDMPAGQRLMPEALGLQLAISPTPVKEALALLERDGLIQSIARRGTMVRRFSAGDVDDIYDARLMIEQRAITNGFAAGRVDAAAMARIGACVGLHARCGSRRAARDLRQALRHDHDLHTLIAALGGNALLREWHQRLLSQTQLARAYSLPAYDAGRVARAQRDHAAILAALQAGDPVGACEALAAHLSNSRADILAEQL